MKLLIATAPLALLFACAQPEPLCDREGQDWNKVETIEDECARPVAPPVSVPDDRDDPTAPPTPEPPVKPPHDPPAKDRTGNPGNHKDVGRAGENPNGKGGYGKGDRGRSR